MNAIGTSRGTSFLSAALILLLCGCSGYRQMEKKRDGLKKEISLVEYARDTTLGKPGGTLSKEWYDKRLAELNTALAAIEAKMKQERQLVADISQATSEAVWREAPTHIPTSGAAPQMPATHVTAPITPAVSSHHH